MPCPKLKKAETRGLFGSCFRKLFLRTVFENTEIIILALAKFSPCSLNLVFSAFFMGTKRILLIFQNKKQFSKNVTKQDIDLLSRIYLPMGLSIVSGKRNAER